MLTYYILVFHPTSAAELIVGDVINFFFQVSCDDHMTEHFFVIIHPRVTKVFCVIVFWELLVILTAPLNPLFNSIWVEFFYPFWFQFKHVYAQQTCECFLCARKFVGSFCQYFICPSSKKRYCHSHMFHRRKLGLWDSWPHAQGGHRKTKDGNLVIRFQYLSFPLRRWSHRRWKINSKM